MLGIGKWKCSVDTLFFKSDINVTVSDKDGEYEFVVDIGDTPIPDYEILEIKQEGDDTLTARGTISMLPGKEIQARIVFVGDTFTGEIKVPMFGKIKLKNGHRVD